MTDFPNTDTGPLARPIRRVVRVSITGLFGLYDHTIPLNTDERVTILHGPNGIGKTIALRLIAAFFAGRYLEFSRVPFSDFKLTLDNGDTVTIKRSHIGKPRKKAPQLQSVRVEHDHGKQRLNETEVKIDDRITTFLARFPYVEQLGADTWLDKEHGDTVATADLLERYAHYVGARTTPYDEPDWLIALRKQVTVHLIEAQRLVRFAAQKREQRALVATVQDCAAGLQTSISEQLQTYGRESQSLDQTFPQRLLRKIAPLSVDDIKSQMAALDIDREKLRRIGLLDERREDRFDATSLDSLEETQRSVMTLYVQDTRSKLAVLTPLARKIELLLKHLSKLKNKTLHVNAKSGLIARGHDGEALPLESLSSGEQHEIVLMYDLLFRVRENSLVLIDEPELSLHIDWQKKFLPDLLEVVQAVRFDVLLATHSIFIAGERPELMVSLSE